MKHLLCIETATTICSVALFKDNNLIGLEECQSENAHSRLLTVYIKSMISENSLKSEDINYIAVSSGPGSYTGLRIGVSVAKGLCFGLSIPLIMIPTTESLANGCIKTNSIDSNSLICAMIDARRMEVYHGFYDCNLNLIGNIESHIITENSYLELLAQKEVYFCGNGTVKLQHLNKISNAHIINNLSLSAKFLLEPATTRINNKIFANLAYDEPLYLKEFLAKEARKML